MKPGRTRFGLLPLYQGVRFDRDKNHKIDNWKSAKTLYNFYRERHGNDFQSVCRWAKTHNPSLVITDFEPTTAEAARNLGLPLISIDNQHKFAQFATRDLPLSLRVYCNFTGWFTERYIGPKTKCVISTFYHELGKTAKPDIVKTNVFIRKELEAQTPTSGDYLLVYYKKAIGQHMLKSLLGCSKQPIKVYGCPPDDRIKCWLFEYHDVDYKKFVADLAGCRAVLCGAGNQLLGEAAYLNKPVFTVPEPNQYEQYVNGYYVEKMGFGKCCFDGKYDSGSINDFLDRGEPCLPPSENGAIRAVEVVKNLVG